MSFYRVRTILSILAVVLVSGSIYAQEKVTVKTIRDLEASGTVVEEDDYNIVVETEKFGILHFQKIRLKTITRHVPQMAYTNDPFGGGGSGGFGGDPFGGGAGATQDPFNAPMAGGGDPFNAPMAGAGDPFAAGGAAPDPFSSAPPAASGGGNPFASGGAAPDPFNAPPAGGNAGNPFASGAAAPDPFNSAQPAATGNPFASGGAAAPDPFNSSPPAASRSGNPFAGGAGAADPFNAPAAGNNAGAVANPFGASPAASNNAVANPFGGGAAPAANNSGGSGFGGFGVPVNQGGNSAANPFAGGGNTTAPASPFGNSNAPSNASNPFDGGGGDPFSWHLPETKTFPGSLPGAGSCILEDNIFLAASATSFDYGDDAKSDETEPVNKPSLPSLPKMKKRTELPTVAEGFDAVLFGIDDQNAVEIKTTEEAEWGTASDDTQLATGNQVRTNQTRSSRILLRGKLDELRLPQESHLIIERLTDDSEEVIINLQAGSVWSEVTPRNQPDAFKVRTPELTAGVRGTNFRVDRLNGASKVSVFTGIVRVTANLTGVGVTLTENQSAVVNIHGQILDILAVPVDEQKIYNEWQEWAMETSMNPGAIAGITATGSLAQTVAQDNARWEASMQEYMRNTAEVKYMEKLDEYAAAFLRYAQDTGTVPAEDEAWTNMKFDPGLDGWNGPYVEGPIPPLDPWKTPLKYKLYKSPVGNIYGRVYSFWEDRRDQGGANANLDRASLIRFFSVEGLEYPEMEDEKK